MNKQDFIKKFISENGQSKKSEIIENIPWGYHRNIDRYVGDILFRMVKNGKLIRVKKGVYNINPKPIKRSKETINPDQIGLKF